MDWAEETAVALEMCLSLSPPAGLLLFMWTRVQFSGALVSQMKRTLALIESRFIFLYFLNNDVH